jgi:O-succinylbenzoic acid--CoA ligase
MHAKWFFSDEDEALTQNALRFLEKWSANSTFQIKSSGTTGLPQLHSFNKTQLTYSAQASIAALGLNKDQRALLCLPLSSVGGLMLLTRSLVGDFELQIQLPSARPLQNVHQQIDFIAMVPTQLQQSLAHDLDKLKQIDQILVGGGQMSPELLAACQSAQLQVWHSYGMTETLSHVALRKVSPIQEPFFKALPGVHFSSINDCLVIHYPQLQQEPIVTKDLVALHDPNTFTWLGRADNAINTGGFKVLPEVLEQQLEKYIVPAFFISALPDEKWGQIVTIVLEASEVPVFPDFQKLGFKPAEIPKRYALVSLFERTETQKIKRKEILQTLTHADWRPL